MSALKGVALIRIIVHLPWWVAISVYVHISVSSTFLGEWHLEVWLHSFKCSPSLMSDIWRRGFIRLRLCKTAITWLRSLSAILPLFWRHAIADLHRLCREDMRNVLWRYEICDVFSRNMTYLQQNMQFSQYFTMKFNIFFLNYTGKSDFFILFISTHRKLSMAVFF